MLSTLAVVLLPLAAAAGGAAADGAAGAARVSLQPTHANVRALLVAAEEGRGDTDLVRDALAREDEANGAAREAPGLTFRVLQVARDPAACSVVQGLLKGPLREVALLHVAACAPDRDVVLGLAQGPFRHDPRALDAIASFLAGQPTLPRADLEAMAAPALDAPLPVSDAARRRAAAPLLARLVKDGSDAVKKQAMRRIVDELPDQYALWEAIADDDADVALPARRVARGAVLEKLHENDAVVALLGDLVGKDCEAALLVGKAERKLRHYAAARTALAAATKPACGEVRKKAQYLEARVARVQNAGSAEKLLLAFVKEHGSDPLVDDVLLWLAEVRAGKGDVKGASVALQSIVDDHAGGDMADEARFRLALSAAKQKQTAQALKLLDDAVVALQVPPRPRVDLLDRARYWRLRLAVFPDVETLTAVAGAKDADKQALSAFAAERGTSFYGVVAAKLVTSLGLPAPAPGEVRSAAADHVPLAPGLAGDARFALAQRALQAGFDDDAAFLLVRVVDDVGAGAQGNVDVVFAAAALFTQAGRPDLAHQTLRNAGLALLPGAPRGAELVRFSLSWPRAFATEIEAAAAAQKIPAPLLMGLAREESAFLHDVVSWAGAIGLCQLMPPTAKDEASAMGKPAPTTQQLLDPGFNALLGAAHLGRRLRGMSHPLLAIAAYNAGPGGVARWMPPKGTKRPLDIFVEDVPVDETRGYIKKVTGSWATYALLDHGLPTGAGPSDRAGNQVDFALWIKN